MQKCKNVNFAMSVGSISTELPILGHI